MKKILALSFAMILSAAALGAEGHLRLKGSCMSYDKDGTQNRQYFDLDKKTNPNFSAYSGGHIHLVADVDIMQKSGRDFARIAIFERGSISASDETLLIEDNELSANYIDYGPDAMYCSAKISRQPSDIIFLNPNVQRIDTDKALINIEVPAPGHLYCGITLDFPGAQADVGELLERLEITGRILSNIEVNNEESQIKISLNGGGWSEFIQIESLHDHRFADRNPLNELIRETLYPFEQTHAATISAIACE